MNATLTLDKNGHLILPAAAVAALGIAPGTEVEAEVTADRIAFVGTEASKVPEITHLERDEEGRLVLPRTGVQVDVVAAIKADREERIRKLSRR